MTILTSTVSILTMPGRKSFRAEVTLGAEAEKSLKQKCNSGFECFMRSFKVTDVKHCWHAISRSGWKKFMRLPQICCQNVANFWLSLSVMLQDVKNHLESEIVFVRPMLIKNYPVEAECFATCKHLHIHKRSSKANDNKESPARCNWSCLPTVAYKNVCLLLMFIYFERFWIKQLLYLSVS